MDEREAALRSRVKELIDDSGSSQRQFAAEVGLDPTKLSKSLSGARRFTSLELGAIAEHASVTVDWILHGSAIQSPSMAARVQEAASGDCLIEAVQRATLLDEIHENLSQLGRVGDVPALPQAFASGRHVQDGEVLAQWAVERASETAGAGPPWSKLPTLIEHAFGIDTAIEPLDHGCDGLAWQRNAFRLIIVNSNLRWTRRTFTLAHELAHILAGDAQELHMDEDVMDPVARRGAGEMRANAFAAAFLMPSDYLRERASDGVSTDVFAKLMGELEVSPDALAWRLFNLKLIDETSRKRYARTTTRQAAARAGWSERYLRRSELTGTKEHPPMLLTRLLTDAYYEGEVSVRPLATVLRHDPDELLRVLDEEAEVTGSTGEEPVFAP